MPAYRFSWDLFDDDTVRELARDIGYAGRDAAGARAYLSPRVARPNDDFVRQTKNTLARVWLPKHPAVGGAIVRELFDMHIGPLGPMPQDGEGCAEYVLKCRNSARLRDLLLGRLISFGDRGRESDAADDEDFVPSFTWLVPSKQPVDHRKPFSCQKEAWRQLDDHFRQAGPNRVFKGVLVMPTGAGKTFTAANWLTRRWLDAGNRVLWLAHREELLAQAARAFSICAGLAPKREQLRLRQVSSRHCRFHQIDPADDIVCCSIHSLARAERREREKLLFDPRLFVVIDEAHHAPAKSYRDMIHLLEQAGTHRLLGLTATPTRMAETERPVLRKLFGDTVVYQISMSELIAQEILAQPIPVTVKTNVDAEIGMTAEDRSHLATFNEPSPDMLARLGQNEHRNRTIVHHYAANAERYGKTLVFTTDVAAAALLADAFREANIEAQYLASYRPDLKEGERIDRRDVLRTYADPRSHLDVLINVEMLTEGVDLPVTKTVFLARPTGSDILFRQMVGRALRGPRVGGNPEAFLVSFEDHWQTYFDYLSPIEWLKESEPVPPPLPITPPPPPLPEPEWPISWEQVIAIARAIRATIPDSAADSFEAVPHGMYVMEYNADGEAQRRVIHVYEHQLPCWDALIAALKGMSKTELEAVEASALYEEFFADCEPPKSPLLDIEAVLERRRAGDAPPDYVELSGRADCDPREIAKLAHEQDLRRSEENALLEERYSILARVIYPTMLEFQHAFDDAMREIEHGVTPPPKGVPCFEPPPSGSPRPGPQYDLSELMAEMLRRGSELLHQPLAHDGTVEWSRRWIKGWYGKAWIGSQPGVGSIRVNVLLDSPDFSRETLLYLLWHEYLHLHLMAGHTPEFRRLEHLWPEHAACDRELDALNEKFGVQYW